MEPFICFFPGTLGKKIGKEMQRNVSDKKYTQCIADPFRSWSIRIRIHIQFEQRIKGIHQSVVAIFFSLFAPVLQKQCLERAVVHVQIVYYSVYKLELCERSDTTRMQCFYIEYECNWYNYCWCCCCCWCFHSAFIPYRTVSAQMCGKAIERAR